MIIPPRPDTIDWKAFFQNEINKANSIFEEADIASQKLGTEQVAITNYNSKGEVVGSGKHGYKEVRYNEKGTLFSRNDLRAEIHYAYNPSGIRSYTHEYDTGKRIDHIGIDFNAYEPHKVLTQKKEFALDKLYNMAFPDFFHAEFKRESADSENFDKNCLYFLVRWPVETDKKVEVKNKFHVPKSTLQAYDEVLELYQSL